MFAIEQDIWLTQTMGCAAYRVEPARTADTAAASERSRQLTAAVKAPGFYYCKVETARVDVCNQLESCGFRLVDTSITFEAGASEISAGPPGGARLARSEDRAAVVRVARSAFTQSRFHLDPKISDHVANEIKAAWVGNFFEGKRGQFMIVAELHGSVAGFLQLLLSSDKCLTIDLIGIDPAARGRGLGRSMISFALVACGPPARLRVGTQAANVRSLRFYESLGFRVAATSHVFHLHNRG